MSKCKMRVVAGFLTLLMSGLAQAADGKPSTACAGPPDQPATAATPAAAAAPYITVSAAKCGTKVSCKLEDDLTITLTPQAGVDPSAPDPRIRIALGSFLKGNDAWSPKCQVELQPSDLRNGTRTNERVISMASFVGDWPGSPLSDVLQNAESFLIPFTVAAVKADGKPDENRVQLNLDATAQFDANRALLLIESAKCSEKQKCQFTRTLELTTPHLFGWMSATRKDAQKLTLMLNGRLITGLDVHPICDRSTANQHECRIDFPLKRHYTDQKNVDAWQAFLSDWQNGPSAVNVALAADGKQISNTVQTEFALVPSSFLWVVLPTMMLLGLLTIIIRSTNVCRDTTATELFGATPPAQIWPTGSQPPFSLGRVQMIFWTVIVLISFSYIFFAAGEWNSLTASTVALLGISATTAVGARFADTPDTEWPGKLITALAEQATANAQVTQAQAALAAAAPGAAQQAAQAGLEAAQTNKATKDANVAALIKQKPKSVQPSRGFWRDIFQTNTNAASLHRVQMVIFTVIFGGIFLWNTATSISMPEFSATMLSLLGISSATYVGFKFT